MSNDTNGEEVPEDDPPEPTAPAGTEEGSDGGSDADRGGPAGDEGVSEDRKSVV